MVPRAKVTLAGHSGAVKSTVADNSGSYTFAGVTPGEYTVQASAPELSLAPPEGDAGGGHAVAEPDVDGGVDFGEGDGAGHVRARR